MEQRGLSGLAFCVYSLSSKSGLHPRLWTGHNLSGMVQLHTSTDNQWTIFITFRRNVNYDTIPLYPPFLPTSDLLWILRVLVGTFHSGNGSRFFFEVSFWLFFRLVSSHRNSTFYTCIIFWLVCPFVWKEDDGYGIFSLPVICLHHIAHKKKGWIR